MKKSKVKIILALGLILFFLVIIVVSSLKRKGEEGSDYKIGILGDDGLAMVSVSKGRQMINYLSLSDEAQVWIPEGMGWYRNQVLKKILLQERKINLLKDITPNVYYQPGDKDSITYPCIVVADNYTDATYSNNNVYNTKHSYTVSYMSRKPFSIEDKMFTSFKYCRHNNNSKIDGVFHEYYRVYF